jgi:hypothetical protein
MLMHPPWQNLWLIHSALLQAGNPLLATPLCNDSHIQTNVSLLLGVSSADCVSTKGRQSEMGSMGQTDEVRSRGH